MKIIPHNRWILVEKVSDTKEKTTLDGFVVPENMALRSKEVEMYKVILQPSEGVAQGILVGDLVVVEDSLVEKKTIFGKDYYFILANHIVCSIRE